MTGAFVIEIAGEIAGVALPDGKSYRFAASAPPYGALDGALFGSVGQVQRAAEQTANARRKSRAGGTPQ